MARSCNSNVPFCCFRFDCLIHFDVQTRTNAHAHIRAHALTDIRICISVRTVAGDRKTMGSAELERVAVALSDIVLHAGAQKGADARIFFSSFYLLICFLLFSFVLFSFVFFS